MFKEEKLVSMIPASFWWCWRVICYKWKGKVANLTNLYIITFYLLFQYRVLNSAWLTVYLQHLKLQTQFSNWRLCYSMKSTYQQYRVLCHYLYDNNNDNNNIKSNDNDNNTNTNNVNTNTANNNGNDNNFLE